VDGCAVHAFKRRLQGRPGLCIRSHRHSRGKSIFSDHRVDGKAVHPTSLRIDAQAAKWPNPPRPTETGLSTLKSGKMPGLENRPSPATRADTLSRVDTKALAWGNQPHTKRLFRIARYRARCFAPFWF